MKKLLPLIIFLAIFSGTNFSNAQATLPQVIPSSPDVSALARYAETPVSYSTGVPDISVPIYNLTSGKLSVPISISYHSGGIRVRDIASIAGLGWSLNAGGMVSRTVLGRRDESNDYVAPYKTTDDLQAARNAVTNDGGATNLCYYYQNMSKLNFETQSDRYAYNFGGKSGVFRFDWQTGAVHLIPYAPLKVSKLYSGTPQTPLNLYYLITDEKGDQYYFQTAETTAQNGLNPTTAWNLTKIISADQKDEIDFYYSTGEIFVQVSEQCRMEKSAGNLNGAPYNIPPISNFTRTPIGSQYAPQRLDSIVSKTASVRFSYAADRQDGRQMRLTNISVFRKGTNVLIRQAQLTQSYFGTSSGHTLRLRLDNIKIGGTDAASMENYSFGYNNGVGPGYYITNGYVFPGGNQFPPYIAEDYWGYSGQGNGGIPSEFLGFLNSSELATYGGNKNPDSLGMQMGILQQIQYPTGGKTVFTFESNKTSDPNFYHYPSQTNANNNIIGGLRVKTIKNYDTNNVLTSQKAFTYDVIGSQQEISAVLFRYQQPVHYYRTDVSGSGLSDLGVLASDVASSSNVYPLTVMGSSPVIYSQVTEYNGTTTDNTGKTTYTYSIPPGTTLESTNILSSPKFINEFTIDRGTPNPLLQTKTVFKNVGGTYTKVSQLDNSYTYLRTNEFLTGIRVDQEMTFNDLNGYYSPDRYDTPYLWDYLNSYTWEATKGYEDIPLLTTEIATDYSDLNNPVAQTTTYQYANLDHLQPTKKTVTTSQGNDTFITDYKYPADFSSGQPYSDMVNTYHIWNPVIEKLDSKYVTSSNTTNFLQSSKTDYQVFNSTNTQIYPALTSTKAGSNSYEARVQFGAYDDNGNIQRVSKSGGSLISYQWGYKKSYPVAQVLNAAENDIFYEGFEEGAGNSSLEDDKTGHYSHTGSYSRTLTGLDPGNYILRYWQRSGTVWTLIVTPVTVSGTTYTIGSNPAINAQIDDVCFYPASAQMTTYTYDPLTGMTSMTDPKGMVTFYEYDDSQRLKNIKDKDGNIVKHIDYHYQGQ
ncbi:hypothetical protein [Mucilaginibacter sp. SJ]|uniref:hypothetical protein n=1 Tax=Mucilaginibacter sp. SJ TaxID=3029053 RepID=UPI0023AA0779|nr:hypothetical protein [Mucilaginibacter sp. SJ]WEA00680.1 hypothetical protein MusilaSJ_24810 [Mucilaginibacter sp. SJ]